MVFPTPIAISGYHESHFQTRSKIHTRWIDLKSRAKMPSSMSWSANIWSTMGALLSWFLSSQDLVALSIGWNHWVKSVKSSSKRWSKLVMPSTRVPHQTTRLVDIWWPKWSQRYLDGFMSQALRYFHTLSVLLPETGHPEDRLVSTTWDPINHHPWSQPQIEGLEIWKLRRTHHLQRTLLWGEAPQSSYVIMHQSVLKPEDWWTLSPQSCESSTHHSNSACYFYGCCGLFPPHQTHPP